MDNLDDSENNVKISDSAYSNSCSNSQSRRSSKSTHSGSNSSGSSGYGGKQFLSSGSSKTLNQLPEKRIKDKEEKKKKKQGKTELVQKQADAEFRLPDPAPATEIKEEPHNASPPSPTKAQTQKGAPLNMEIIEENANKAPAVSNTPQSPITQIVTSKPCCSEDFSCVISMHDGVVLYMTSSLTASLGFPKDMWIGRSFIDFVHPLDHNTFASQITNGLAVPKKENYMQNAVQSPGNSVATMFCRIRRHRGLDSGFGIKDRVVSFRPYMLKLSFKNACDEKGMIIYLVIQATPLFSAFKIPNEIIVNAVPFVMRHVANGNLEYIDNEAVQFLGYLPQDITGQDVLNLYHPEDLSYVRHMYETMVKLGRVPRSKPYRLMVQNGHYLKLETEWSSFINPWSKKLEFVIGKHHIIEGPSNPDVFQAPPISKNKISEPDNVDIEGLKESIMMILNEVPTRPAELAKQQMTKRCQDLASFMESLIEEQPKPEEELRLEIQENDNSYYERDSVMLGGISPHHDYSDSKSSTETPLSYTQLNFNINLKRYFDSHQESFEEEILKCAEANTAIAKGQDLFSEGCMSPIVAHHFSYSDINSAESASLSFAEENPMLPGEYHPRRLTESLLTKHNSEMEKIFVKKHRETRPANKEEREKISHDTKQKKKDHLVRCNASFVPTAVSAAVIETQPHGLKRASKQAEVEAHKQHCASSRQMRRRCLPATPTLQPSVTVATVSTSASMWTPNYMNGPFMSQQMSFVSPFTAVPGFVPMYYVPTTGPTVPCSTNTSAPEASRSSSQQQFQAPTMQYMMYGQAVFGSPVMVSPINQAPFPNNSLQQNVMQNEFVHAQNNLKLTTRNYEEACKPGLPLKPPGKSQLAAWREEKRAAAFSGSSSNSKAGLVHSRNSSISSASNALNRSIEIIPESVVSRGSKMKTDETVDRTDGESSYSSFYSSFFKTESGSAEDSGDAKKSQNRTKSIDFGAQIPGKENIRNKQIHRKKNEPPWMEQVCVTSELIYKYQVLTKSLDEVLISDKKKLVGVEQPLLVNEQLGQLYMDLQLEGVAARLTLEEGLTSSGSSSDEIHKKFAIDTLSKRPRRKRKYSKLVMIFEEDAPLPPPDDEPQPEPSTSVA